MCWAPSVAHAGDPYLTWWTLSTPHFRVHYHSGLESIAQRAATVAERAHSRLVPQLGWETSQLTHVVITDQTDAANGIASGVPYNSILLFVTAPEDMSPLNDYDDWQLDLITHEYTHILHVDNISGLPAVVNAVLGRVLTPNQTQPRWILEGLAVAMESAHTSAGRLRGTLFDMYLRADVLADNLASLDEISNHPRRWPSANLWYLYGAKFVDWILQTYGRETFAEVATHYGRWIFPYGVNRAIRRATGLTYPELYGGWKLAIESHYQDMARQIRARGVREGTRLTHHGQVAFHPRFVPAACQRGREPELLYYRDDGEERPGLYRVSANATAAEHDAEIAVRTNQPVASFAPDCTLYFESTAPSRRGHFLVDLFRAGDAGDGARERLTTGVRARDPDIGPDGRKLVYVTNNAGTSTLRIAEIDSARGVHGSEPLVPSARFEQAYTPRFSPDGRRVAYSAWTRGGYRDIRIVDVATKTFELVTDDRALDQQPAWSPDGKTLFFTSDRTGVPNVYAYELETRALRQVTNVLNGAYMPAVSRDGKTLAYAGYTTRGFDLYVMALDRSRYLEAPPPPPRESGAVTLPTTRWPVSRYSALPTLAPRALDVEYGTGTFGNALILTASGNDAVGHHSFVASLTVETESSGFRGSLDYAYRRLPASLQASLFRSRFPRRDYRIGESNPVVSEDGVGLTTAVGMYFPGEFDAESVALSYTLLDFTHDRPLGRRVDPWSELPSEPSSSLLGSVRLAYGYSNAESSAYAISPERGFSAGLATDFADPALGGDETLASVTGSVTSYFRLPWRRHHVLALALSGGSSSGTYPRRGYFATGGFADQPAFDVYTTGVRQSGFVLRGYEPAQFIGSEYALFNAELRFPIVYVDRGVSTLPVFLRHLSGTLFFDYGGAYFAIDPRDPLAVFHPAVGAELWTELVFGYRIGGTLRLGVAKGLDDFAPDGLATYFVAASAF